MILQWRIRVWQNDRKFWKNIKNGRKNCDTQLLNSVHFAKISSAVTSWWKLPIGLPHGNHIKRIHKMLLDFAVGGLVSDWNFLLEMCWMLTSSFLSGSQTQSLFKNLWWLKIIIRFHLQWLALRRPFPSKDPLFLNFMSFLGNIWHKYSPPLLVALSFDLGQFI